MTTSPTNSAIDDLEHRARAERAVLHQRATELKIKVDHVRENLDIHHNARRHFGAAAAILAGIGLLTGYALAGLLTDH